MITTKLLNTPAKELFFFFSKLMYFPLITKYQIVKKMSIVGKYQSSPQLHAL